MNYHRLLSLIGSENTIILGGVQVGTNTDPYQIRIENKKCWLDTYREFNEDIVNRIEQQLEGTKFATSIPSSVILPDAETTTKLDGTFISISANKRGNSWYINRPFDKRPVGVLVTVNSFKPQKSYYITQYNPSGKLLNSGISSDSIETRDVLVCIPHSLQLNDHVVCVNSSVFNTPIFIVSKFKMLGQEVPLDFQFNTTPYQHRMQNDIIRTLMQIKSDGTLTIVVNDLDKLLVKTKYYFAYCGNIFDSFVPVLSELQDHWDPNEEISGH